LAKVGTSKAGSTISQIGCGTSVACHGKPIEEEEEEEEEEPYKSLSLPTESIYVDFRTKSDYFSTQN
jgi:hypothetical protein